MNKRILSIFVAIIITITLLVILFSQIELSNIIEILTKINPIYLIAGFIFYAASYVLRALRLHILLNKEISVKELFSIICIHVMALNILPARSGELSYIYLLNKRHKRTAGEGAASLIIIRIMDIITVSLFFFISIFLIHDLPPIVMNATRIISVFMFSIVVFILMFIWNCDRFIYLLRMISVYLKVNEKKIVNYLLTKLDEMSGTFKKLTHRQFVYCMIISIGSWIMIYSVIYLVIKSMGINMLLEPFLLASTFFLISSILPIQGIGGFGTFEGGWAISFISMGLTKETAISSGFVVHVIILYYLFILFIIGLIRLPKN